MIETISMHACKEFLRVPKKGWMANVKLYPFFGNLNVTLKNVITNIVLEYILFVEMHFHNWNYSFELWVNFL